jgi:DNA recombination protein RmuC
MEILLIVMIALVSVSVVMQLRGASRGADQSILSMQQQLESLRGEVRSSLQHVTENVNHQLTAVTHQIQSQTGTVGDRLDHATRVIGDVQKELGTLGQATQEMKELGQNMSKLEELLSAPKLRGGLGEFLLEDLLRQVLPADHLVMQYRFRSGQIVDAVIRTADHLVPVDSKFPLENFRKMASAPTEGERRAAAKIFSGDVKKHIDAIATKYILPDEGTFPFALMYIPAESIYYEVIVKDDNEEGLYEYAIARRVVPVSPNSFYAYLQVIALGLRGLAIEQGAREIVDTLARMQGDLLRVREVFDVLGSHIENARKKYDEAEKRLSTFEGRLEQVSDRTLAEARPVADHAA